MVVYGGARSGRDTGRPQGVLGEANTLGERGSVVSQTTEPEVIESSLADLDAGGLEEVIGSAWLRASLGSPTVFEVPTGVGKSRAARAVLVSHRAGYLAVPNHRLADEAVAGFAGTPVLRLEGKMRLFERENPKMASQLRPLVEQGWGLDDLAEALGVDLPVAAHGDGEITVMMHEHLRAPLFPPRHPRRTVSGPVIVDESPAWTHDVEVSLADLQAAATPLDDRLRRWLREAHLGPVARLFLDVALASMGKRRSAGGKDPFARHDRGTELAHMVTAAAGGRAKLQNLVQRAFRLDRNGRIDRGWPLREPPMIPAAEVLRGDVQWVRRDIDWVLRELVDEVLCGLHPEWERRGGAGLRTGGGPKAIWAAYVVMRPWAACLTPGVVPIILDAAAWSGRELYAKCYPGIRLVRVVVTDGRTPVRVHLPIRSASRHRLLAEADADRALSDRTPAVIERILSTATEAMVQHNIRREAKAVLVVPMAVEAALRSSIAVARGEGTTEDDAAVQREELDGVVDRVRDAQRLGILSQLEVTHYGLERGTNEFSGFDAVITLPNVPNIGDVGDQEHALGVTVTMPGRTWVFGPIARSAEESSYTQAHGRLRALRADGPRLLMHVGRDAPRTWGGDYIALPEVRGGRVPASEHASVAACVDLLFSRTGVASARLILWLRDHPDRIDALASGDEADRLRALLSTIAASDRTLDRCVHAVERTRRWSGSWHRCPAPDRRASWTVFAATAEQAASVISKLCSR